MLRSLSAMGTAAAIHEFGNLRAKPVMTRTTKQLSRIRCCQRWFSVIRTMLGFCILCQAAALLLQMMALCRNMKPITAKINGR